MKGGSGTGVTESESLKSFTLDRSAEGVRAMRASEGVAARTRVASRAVQKSFSEACDAVRASDTLASRCAMRPE
jgi:hypothetical protein